MIYSESSRTLSIANFFDDVFLGLPTARRRHPMFCENHSSTIRVDEPAGSMLGQEWRVECGSELTRTRGLL